LRKNSDTNSDSYKTKAVSVTCIIYQSDFMNNDSGFHVKSIMALAEMIKMYLVKLAIGNKQALKIRQ